ncbi:MAG: hypothetical protein GF421_11265 [Candidatus Aminicenantes bacterium]|nr:hypothetical protein [Candidatus Aminicenantes bacterium]
MSILCFIVSSCSHHNIATTMRSNNLKAYSGPAQPKDSVGYLFCASSNLVIDAIDSTSVSLLKAQTNQQGSFAYIELLPGEHTIFTKGSTFHTSQRGFHPNQTVDISSQTVSMRGESELSFAVKPDHVYILSARIIKNKNTEANSPTYTLTIYIKDALTKKIVSKIDSEIHKNKKELIP